MISASGGLGFFTISYHCGGSLFLTWYQSHALNLIMSIESSSVEQISNTLSKHPTCFDNESVVKGDSSVKQRVHSVRGF